MEPLLDANTALTILGIITNLAGLGYIAVRVEHRLTKMETQISFLIPTVKKDC